VFVAAGVGSTAEVERAKQEAKGFGLFVRSLVGLDEQAIRRALGRFVAGQTTSADQLEFIDLVTAHLARHGFMDPGLLYDSPFTDIHPRGPEGLFSSSQVDELVAVLAEIQRRAA
jgi:type I restriction enzyme R subunit